MDSLLALLVGYLGTRMVECTAAKEASESKDSAAGGVMGTRTETKR